MSTQQAITSAPVRHVQTQLEVGFNYEHIGCAVAFFDHRITEEEIAETVHHFQGRNITAVPVYEEERLDFFFLFPADASHLEHPRRFPSANTQMTHFMIVTPDEVARLATEMTGLGFALIEGDRSFSFERAPAGTTIH
ncbi:MAG: hypothetical protein HY986_16615 [Candidatus Melainabacteria bacterium]|nr:hypothetical protein [Candidatus Melainabacteria bacterium]